MIWAVAVLRGTDVGFAEAWTNAQPGVYVVMCQTAAGSKLEELHCGDSSMEEWMVSTSVAPEVYIGPWLEKMEENKGGIRILQMWCQENA